MTATREDVQRWLEEGKEKGATHLIVACDTFDYENYPVFVMPGESCEKRGEEAKASRMQSVDEVYDLAEDVTRQLSELRAMHVTS